jgi:hypothetical protein
MSKTEGLNSPHDEHLVVDISPKTINIDTTHLGVKQA